MIGLEIHAQIASQTKLFSSAASQVFGCEPNTCTSFVDIAFPGMLPVVNRECVLQAARLGLAVGGVINLCSVLRESIIFTLTTQPGIKFLNIAPPCRGGQPNNYPPQQPA